MKLVVKFNETLKLVTSQTSYQELLSTIQREFHLQKDTIHLYYIDEEGDRITMGEEDDLQIMKTVHEGKEYVKIYVEAEVVLNFSKQKNIFQESSIRFDDISEMPSEESKMARRVHEEADLSGRNQKMETSVIEAQEKPELPIKEAAVVAEVAPFEAEEMREIRLINSRLEVDSVIKQQSSKVIQSKKEEINEKQLKDTVAKLVDQRIKILLPCLRELLLSQREERLDEDYKLIHENIECNGCLANPIVGVRYECLYCPHFNLCQRCETKIYHKHNLLKVKQIAGEEKVRKINEEFNDEKSINSSIIGEPFESKKNKRFTWDSKRYNFNDINLDESHHQDRRQRVEVKQSQIRRSIPKIEEPLKRPAQFKRQERVIQKEEPMPIFKEKNVLALKQKQAMLVMMKQIFGGSNANLEEYRNMIDTHFAKGMDQIISLFMDSQAKKK